MSVVGNFSLDRGADGTLTFGVAPPTAIGGMSIQFLLTKRLGGVSGLYQAWVGSGLNNLSGINITNSGQGYMQITIPSSATSGLDPTNYAFKVARTDSGFYTTLAEGQLVLLP
jgi:hypothetical protein